MNAKAGLGYTSSDLKLFETYQTYHCFYHTSKHKIMSNSLTNELLQLQKSRCAFKYAEMVDGYMKEVPARVGQTLNRPMDSIVKNISIVNRFRGKMLLNLERKLSISWNKLKRYAGS